MMDVGRFWSWKDVSCPWIEPEVDNFNQKLSKL